MARLPLARLYALLLAVGTTIHADILPNPKWLVPDGSNADLTTTWNNGDSITLSWAGLNSSICDLWLTSYVNTSDYAVRIASNINVENAGTLPWTINVGSEQIKISDEFVLRFIPTGTTYKGDLQLVQIPSPGFVVLDEAAALATATSTASAVTSTISIATQGAAATTAATSTDSSYPSSTAGSSSTPTPDPGTNPPSDGGGLSIGVKVGAAIAVIASLCIIIALLLWVIRLRRRVKAVNNQRSQGIVPVPRSVAMEMTPHEKRISGLHEVHGDKLQPQELSTVKERKSVYEMPG